MPDTAFTGKTTLKSPKNATPSFSLQNKYFPFHTFHRLSCLLNYCPTLLGVCAPESSSFRVTLVLAEYWTGLGFTTIYDVIIILMSAEEMYRLCYECKNSLLVTTSEHASLHSGAQTYN